jgi:opacity protein-like surface antigen
MASLVAVASAAAPAKASADWLFTPFIGSTFGGSADIGGAGDSFSDKFHNKVNYGAALEWMGGGVFGFGVDFGYSPNFFRDSDTGEFGDGNVTTLMGNLIIGAPLGPVRPYASGGVGLMKQKVDNVGQFFDTIDNSDFGYNVGGGVMGFFSDNVGIRGDLRYFRSVKDVNLDAVDLELGSFKFWRGTVGVTFKF